LLSAAEHAKTDKIESAEHVLLSTNFPVPGIKMGL